MTGATLYAISDLHVGQERNRQVVQSLRPSSEADWLIVAGDVGEMFADIEWALTLLSERFEKVIWTPGNHELWTVGNDPVQARGAERYGALVQLCRRLGVVCPEDEYPVWTGAGGPALIVPMFLLYDYTFRTPNTLSKEESLQRAYESGVVCTDEILLFPDPYPSREAWCAERVAITEQRLAGRDRSLPTVLVNHFPLVRELTRVLRYPQFAQWCGTERSADWHRRYGAIAVVYGHLHIPRVTWLDGVCFQERSVGYPQEWEWRGSGVEQQWLSPVLPLVPAGH